MKPSSSCRKRIGRVSPFQLYSTCSPCRSARTTRRYSRNAFGFTGSKPITRIAVWPVPIPRNTRPGAIRLMLAMEWAVTGAMRVPAIATPVPSWIVDVCCAARAIVA